MENNTSINSGLIEIPIVYRSVNPVDFKVSMHKSMDTNCEEYERFLPKMETFIKRHKWKYAYSMPKTPHWYVCRDKLTEKLEIDEFNSVARFIQKYGYDRAFFAVDIRYLKCGMYKYWTMGRHWEKTIIINRAAAFEKDER